MTKDELQEMNAALISLLTSLRDEIDNAMEELGVAPDNDDSGCDDDLGD